MARQISMETGLAAYRKKCSELLDANILLEAQLAELEAENANLKSRVQDVAPGAPEEGHAG